MSARAMDWISGGDVGTSSRTIWRHMMGLPPTAEWYRGGIPLDPDDFGRCYRLLEAMPEWRGRIAEMAAYPLWRPVALAWEELTALYERDIDRSGAVHRGRSEALYARLHTLVDEGYALAGKHRVVVSDGMTIEAAP